MHVHKHWDPLLCVAFQAKELELSLKWYAITPITTLCAPMAHRSEGSTEGYIHEGNACEIGHWVVWVGYGADQTYITIRKAQTSFSLVPEPRFMNIQVGSTQQIITQPHGAEANQLLMP